MMCYSTVLLILFVTQSTNALYGTVPCIDQGDLVKYLQFKGYLNSSYVAHIMSQVDRKFYVPESPYQTVWNVDLQKRLVDSAPPLHALVLQTLEKHLRKGNKALIIGFHSGYLAVCMGLMVGKSGTVIGVEDDPQIMSLGVDNIFKNHIQLAKCGTIDFKHGNWRKTAVKYGPYDAIYVSPVSLETPKVLLEQLNDGGRMMIPTYDDKLQLTMLTYDKIDGNITVISKPLFITNNDYYIERYLWEDKEFV